MSEFRMYLRDKHKQPHGIILANKVDDKIHVGWSVCNKKDKWNRAVGVMIAESRSGATKYYNMQFEKYCELAPQKVRENMPRFIDRAKRYFKVSGDALPVYLKTFYGEE